MRALISGDRNWRDSAAMRAVIDSLPDGSTVIEGEARGADTMARVYAERRGLTVEKYPALWDRHGRAAGPIRNLQMLREGKPDVVIWFHNDFANSRGTKHMVSASIEAGVPTYRWDKWLEERRR